MKTPTGSSLGLAGRCPTSHCLPWASDTGAYAERGIDIHDGLATGKPTVNLEGIPPLDAGIAEVAFVIDLSSDSARVAGTNIGRAYPPLTDGQIALSADWVSTTNGHGVVLDWKSGGEGEPCATDMQMRALSYAAARVYGWDRVLAAKVYVDEDRAPWIDRHEFDAFELSLVRDELVSILARVKAADETVKAGGVPDVSTGEWCRRCKSIASCPKTVAIVRWSADLAKKDATPALTHENAAELYAFLRHLDAARDKAWTLIREWAIRSGGIDLGDGLRYGPTKGAETIADQEAVRARLLAMDEAGATALAASTAKWKTSKAQLTKVLGKAEATSLLADLRAAGHLKTSERVEEHRTRAALPSKGEEAA